MIVQNILNFDTPSSLEIQQRGGGGACVSACIWLVESIWRYI